MLAAGLRALDNLNSAPEAIMTAAVDPSAAWLSDPASPQAEHSMLLPHDQRAQRELCSQPFGGARVASLPGREPRGRRNRCECKMPAEVGSHRGAEEEAKGHLLRGDGPLGVRLVI